MQRPDRPRAQRAGGARRRASHATPRPAPANARLQIQLSHMTMPNEYTSEAVVMRVPAVSSSGERWVAVPGGWGRRRLGGAPAFQAQRPGLIDGAGVPIQSRHRFGCLKARTWGCGLASLRRIDPLLPPSSPFVPPAVISIHQSNPPPTHLLRRS